MAMLTASRQPPFSDVRIFGRHQAGAEARSSQKCVLGWSWPPRQLECASPKSAHSRAAAVQGPQQERF